MSVEKARDELEGAKEEAEHFLSKERELLKLNAHQAQLFLAAANAAHAKATEQVREMTARRRHGPAHHAPRGRAFVRWLRW